MKYELFYQRALTRNKDQRSFSFKGPFNGKIMGGCIMAKHQVYTMSSAKMYSCYVKKAEKKGRTK